MDQRANLKIFEKMFSKDDKSILASLPADLSVNYFIDEKVYSDFAEYKLNTLVSPSKFIHFVFRFSFENFLNFTFYKKLDVDNNGGQYMAMLEDFEIQEINLKFEKGGKETKYYLTIDHTLSKSEGRNVISEYLLSRFYLEDLNLIKKTFVIEDERILGHLSKIDYPGDFLVKKMNIFSLSEKIHICILIFRNLEKLHFSNVEYFDIDIRSSFLIKSQNLLDYEDVIFLNKKATPNFYKKADLIKEDYYSRKSRKTKKCIENFIYCLFLLFDNGLETIKYKEEILFNGETNNKVEKIIDILEITKNSKSQLKEIFKRILVNGIYQSSDVFDIIHAFYQISRELRIGFCEEFVRAPLTAANIQVSTFEAPLQEPCIEGEKQVEESKKQEANDLVPSSVPKYKPRVSKIVLLQRTDNIIIPACKPKHSYLVKDRSKKFTIWSEPVRKMIDPDYQITKFFDRHTTNFEINEFVIINNPSFIKLMIKKFNENLKLDSGSKTSETSKTDSNFTLPASKVLKIDDLQKLIEESDLLISEAEREYNENNFLRAKELYELCIELRLRSIGENKKETALAITGLAGVYMKMGMYKVSLEVYFRSIKIYRETIGKDHILVASVLHNIGLIYDLLNIYDTALEYYNMALEIKIDKLGDFNQSTATTYYNIGGIYDIKGKFSEALKTYEITINIYNRVYGTEINIDTASVYNSVGLVYDKLNRSEESINNYSKSLDISIKLLGEHHPLVATSYNNMGLVYFKSNKIQEAIENFEKSIQIRESLSELGFQNADIASSYNNLGGIYFKFSKYDLALQNYIKSLKYNISLLGNFSPETGTCYNNIGLVYVKLKENPKALEYFKKSHDIRIKIFGENDKETLSTLLNIAGVYFKLKDFKICIEYYSKVLKIFSKIYGEKSSELIKVYNNLGYSYTNISMLGEAFKCYSNCLDICLKNYGENSHYTSEVYLNISNYYENINDDQKAKEYKMKSNIFLKQ